MLGLVNPLLQICIPIYTLVLLIINNTKVINLLWIRVRYRLRKPLTPVSTYCWNPNQPQYPMSVSCKVGQSCDMVQIIVDLHQNYVHVYASTLRTAFGWVASKAFWRVLYHAPHFVSLILSVWSAASCAGKLVFCGSKSCRTSGSLINFSGYSDTPGVIWIKRNWCFR